MRVELDVFSGRPNPWWELADEEATAIAALLKDLPSAAPPPSESGLGFRGFAIDIPHGEAGAPTHVRVGSGIVTVEGEGGQERYFQDTRGIERRLSDLAERHGYGELLRF